MSYNGTNKSWLLGIVGIGMVVGLLYLSVLLLSQAELHQKQEMVGSISKIYLTGKGDKIRAVDIEEKLQPLLTENFIDLDLEAIQQSIESLQWVRKAAVGRVYPATLKVGVEEQESVAKWNSKFLINRWGEVFGEGTEEELSGLANLECAKESLKQILKMHVKLGEVLHSGSLKLKSLKQDKNGIYGLSFINGLEVKLGRKFLEKRVLRLNKVLKAIRNNPGLVSYIDMRYKSGLAIKFKQPSSSYKRDNNV